MTSQRCPYCHLDAQASCNPGYTLQGKTCAAITCSLGENENCRTCRAQDARTAKDECDLAERFNDFNEQCHSETISSLRTHAAALHLKYLDYLPTHILSPQLDCFSTIFLCLSNTEAQNGNCQYSTLFARSCEPTLKNPRRILQSGLLPLEFFRHVEMRSLRLQCGTWHWLHLGR